MDDTLSGSSLFSIKHLLMLMRSVFPVIDNEPFYQPLFENCTRVLKMRRSIVLRKSEIMEDSVIICVKVANLRLKQCCM